MCADGLLVHARFDGAHDAGRLARSLRRHHVIPFTEQALDEALAESPVVSVDLRKASLQEKLERRVHRQNGRKIGDARLEASRIRVELKS